MEDPLQLQSVFFVRYRHCRFSKMRVLFAKMSCVCGHDVSSFVFGYCVLKRHSAPAGPVISSQKIERIVSIIVSQRRIIQQRHHDSNDYISQRLYISQRHHSDDYITANEKELLGLVVVNLSSTISCYPYFYNSEDRFLLSEASKNCS